MLNIVGSGALKVTVWVERQVGGIYLRYNSHVGGWAKAAVGSQLSCRYCKL